MNLKEITLDDLKPDYSYLVFWCGTEWLVCKTNHQNQLNHRGTNTQVLVENIFEIYELPDKIYLLR